jgi:hypothetical protein
VTSRVRCFVQDSILLKVVELMSWLSKLAGLKIHVLKSDIDGVLN